MSSLSSLVERQNILPLLSCSSLANSRNCARIDAESSSIAASKETTESVTITRLRFTIRFMGSPRRTSIRCIRGLPCRIGPFRRASCRTKQWPSSGPSRHFDRYCHAGPSWGLPIALETNALDATVGGRLRGYLRHYLSFPASHRGLPFCLHRYPLIEGLRPLAPSRLHLASNQSCRPR